MLISCSYVYARSLELSVTDVQEELRIHLPIITQFLESDVECSLETKLFNTAMALPFPSWLSQAYTLSGSIQMSSIFRRSGLIPTFEITQYLLKRKMMQNFRVSSMPLVSNRHLLWQPHPDTNSPAQRLVSLLQHKYRALNLLENCNQNRVVKFRSTKIKQH